MARVPNEKAAKAEAMYHDGMKLVDIARKLDVPPGTVRRWKSTYHWDGNSKKKQNERSDTETMVALVAQNTVSNIRKPSVGRPAAFV